LAVRWEAVFTFSVLSVYKCSVNFDISKYKCGQ